MDGEVGRVSSVAPDRPFLSDFFFLIGNFDLSAVKLLNVSQEAA